MPTATRSPADYIFAARRHEHQVELLENTALKTILGDFAARSEEVGRSGIQDWVRTVGPLGGDFDAHRAQPLVNRVSDKLIQLLEPAVEKAQPVLFSSMESAYLLGRQQSAEVIPGARLVGALALAPSVDLRAILLGFQAVLRARPALTITLGSLALVGLLAEARRAHAKVTSVVTTELNSAQAQGQSDVIDENPEYVRIWVAERDACLHCLAYQGHWAHPGQPFPGGLTFATKSYHPDPVDNPPLHPNCRCDVQPVRLPEARVASEPLMREAERSVLKGWSLPSESNRQRIKAADRLLNRGTTLPKSVQAQAQAAVRRGQFASRAVPR